MTNNEDVISRQTLLKYATYVELANGNKGWVVEKGFIEDIPSIQPKQRIGHWKPIGRLDDMDCICHLCSECQKPFPWKTNYCPNCGAKMEENK